MTTQGLAPIAMQAEPTDSLWDKLARLIVGNPVQPITPAILKMHRDFYDILEKAAIAIPWEEAMKDRIPTHIRRIRTFLPWKVKCPACPAPIAYYEILFSMTIGKRNEKPFFSELEIAHSFNGIAANLGNRKPLVGTCENGHRFGALKEWIPSKECACWCFYDLGL